MELFILGLISGLFIQPILESFTSLILSFIEMINVGQPYPTDPVEQIANIIERSPEIIGRIKALFKKKERDNETGSDDSEQETE